MKEPTTKQLNAWSRKHAPDRYEIRTCHDCGTVGPEWEVQLQHPYYMDGIEGLALCVPCINDRNLRANEARKKQIADLPRCEVPGCTRRGTWRMGYARVLLCGRHSAKVKTRAKNDAANLGAIGLFGGVDYPRDQMLAIAQEK